MYGQLCCHQCQNRRGSGSGHIPCLLYTSTRPTLSVKRIAELIAFVKGIRADIICMVDNCYGEFVERIEPSDVGADMVVGSLIKNPGGGLAPIGGYIAGTKKCIENAAYRLGSPGLGREVGASLGVNQALFQGLFLAPTVVAGALKGAVFAANIYEALGFQVCLLYTSFLCGTAADS